VTAAELLIELHRLGIHVEAVGGRLRTGPAGAVPDHLRRPVVAHHTELVDLVQRTCRRCGVIDYLPLGGGWHRCWACGARWGTGRDPGDPPDLAACADLLGVTPAARRPRPAERHA
jgi:TubC N-terminal docking domain